MKKNQMAEQVALKNLNVTLRNLQNYITKDNPSDVRLATLQAIQQQVEKNVPPLEELKSIQESLRVDYKNQGDFKSALAKIAPTVAQNTSPPDNPAQKSEAQPVPARPAPVTSAQVVPSRARGHVLVGDKGMLRGQIKHLITQSQNQNAAATKATKPDPQKENILQAFQELSQKDIGYNAGQKLEEAKKGFSEGKSSPQVLRDFLKKVINPKTETKFGRDFTNITKGERELLQKIMQTEGLQKAIANDPAIRSALREVEGKLPAADKKIIASEMPTVQKTAAMKK